jgi:hypothetical protein
MKSTIVLRIAVGVIGFALGSMVVIGHAESLSHTSQNLTPYRTCTITATPSSTTAVRDAHVLQTTPTTNFGTVTTLDVSSATNANRRVHLWFNLALCTPAIPATATVRLATVRVYVTTLAAACRTIAVFRVGASAWTEAAITWNNQPFGTTINNPALGTATAQFNVGTPVGCTNRVAGYVTGATVTADVAAFVAGTSTNNGWMLRDSVEGSATARTNTFSAKNLGTLAQAPQLVVTYVTLP